MHFDWLIQLSRRDTRKVDFKMATILTLFDKAQIVGRLRQKKIDYLLLELRILRRSLTPTLKGGPVIRGRPLILLCLYFALFAYRNRHFPIPSSLYHITS